MKVDLVEVWRCSSAWRTGRTTRVHKPSGNKVTESGRGPDGRLHEKRKTNTRLLLLASPNLIQSSELCMQCNVRSIFKQRFPALVLGSLNHSETNNCFAANTLFCIIPLKKSELEGETENFAILGSETLISRSSKTIEVMTQCFGA